MDLRSLMNNDSSEAARQAQPQPPPPPHQTREPQQRNSIQPPPPLRTSSIVSASYASPPLQHRQAYAPKPTPPLYQHSPTHAPGQPPGGNGYPFPSTAYQSPSQQQQYRTHDAYQAVTPSASRPPAPLYQYSPRQNASPSFGAQGASSSYGPQSAPSPYGAPPPPPAALHHSASHSSMSPTPPALHHLAPHNNNNNNNHHPYPINNQHPSQPSTPLGPPSSLQYPRPLVQAQSPYANLHHRTSSGASYGPPQSAASNSPAQVMAIGHMAESPAAYAHQGQPKRAASGGYVSEAERERSISVSPKTVVPRHGSQGSYYSSHDAGSARNSTSAAFQPEHDRMPTQIQPQHEPQHLRSSGDMSHDISPLTTTRPPPSSFHAPPAPSPSSRSSQTPKLKNLLNDGHMTHPSRPASQSQDQDFSPHSHPPAASSYPAPANNMFGAQTKPEPPMTKTGVSGFPQESLLQQPVTTPTPTYTPAPVPAAEYGRQPVPMKRPAESSPESTHAVKRAKRRYPEPPIWARFAKSNPRYGDNAQSLPPPEQMQQARRPPPGNRATAAQANGHGPHAATANGTPSMANTMPNMMPRLGPWECNIKNVQPMNDFLKEVGDFLIVHATRNDIGAGDVRGGALEIEAKLGTLIDRDTNNRVATLGTTRMVLDHGMTNSGRFRFESFMTEAQHKQMNDYLNNAVQRSMEPHRVRMGYKHRYERDSFSALNQAGFDALPGWVKAQVRPGHSLKLRTTHDTKAPPGHGQYEIGAVLGRIVKVRLDDLDIHCPKMDFDCRISVNIEVDLNNRADVDPLLIVDEQASGSKGRALERNKDRLSYQHLAYSVDLTQVTLPTGQKTHELEIEMDSAKLREEASRCIQGQENAYETLVDGLLSNVFTLMKAQKEWGGVPQGR